MRLRKRKMQPITLKAGSRDGVLGWWCEKCGRFYTGLDVPADEVCREC